MIQMVTPRTPMTGHAEHHNALATDVNLLVIEMNALLEQARIQQYRMCLCEGCLADRAMG